MDCRARLPCPSPTPGAYSTYVHCISVATQPSHPLSYPPPPTFNLSQHQGLTNESILHIRWPKYWNFNIGTSVSVFPMNIQDWFPLGWTVWISLQSKGLSRVFSNTTIQKASILRCSAFFIVQLSHPYMTTGKTIALTRWTFVGTVMSLLFNNAKLVVGFLPSSKRLLISWLQSPSAMTLEPKKRKSVTFSIVSPSICHEVMGPDATILVF